MGIKSLVKNMLMEQQNKKYARLLAAKSITYDQWIRTKEQEQDKLYADRQQGAFAGTEEECEFIHFLQPGAKLAKDAFKKLELYFKEHPEVQICYGDEDVLKADGTREYPWFKPDWSPDLFDSYYYFGGLVAVRKSLWYQAVAKIDTEVEPYRGTKTVTNVTTKINVEMVTDADAEIVADADVEMGADADAEMVTKTDAGVNAGINLISCIRKCAELVGGWQKGCKAIGHIPEILSHWESKERMEECLQKVSCEELEKKGSSVLSKNFKKGNFENTKPLISVVIPSKDQPGILKKCLQGILETTNHLSYEIVIVDNGSSTDNRRLIEQMTAEYQEREKSQCCKGVQYLYKPMEFHFSKMCNLGAEHAAGELLLFLNDDVELCEKDSLLKMAELAIRDNTGAVGLKLYYPKSTRIQHAGITNLPMGPVHKLQFLEDNVSYYFDSNRGLRNVLAVTAACLMVSKEKFIEAGGFAKELRVAFNDVDFCFKLYELGYYNVCRNDYYAYHHESLSRGDDESTEKWKRLQEERAVLYDRHPVLRDVDPYYGRGLGREGLDTRIRPAYETAGNTKQQAHFAPWKKDISSYRQDNCLMVRIENCREGMIQGYGVVLGDNNACYEYELLLKNVETQEVHSVIIEGQYRPDLVENMPDQVNVGLCGLCVCINGMQQESVQPDSQEPTQAGLQNQQECSAEITTGHQKRPDSKDGTRAGQQNESDNYVGIAAGQYQIGMTARNRVTGLKLINFSSRILTIPD